MRSATLRSAWSIHPPAAAAVPSAASKPASAAYRCSAPLARNRSASSPAASIPNRPSACAATRAAPCVPSLPHCPSALSQRPSARSSRCHSSQPTQRSLHSAACRRLSSRPTTAAQSASATGCSHLPSRSFSALRCSPGLPSCVRRVRSSPPPPPPFAPLSGRRSFHSSASSLAPKRDYYDVLGVQRGAGRDELKKAYFALAKRYHPDTVQGDKAAAAEKFAEVSNAYEVLSDDARRQRYDAMGAAGEEMGGADMGGGGMGGQAGYNPEDILRDFFGSMGGGGARSPFGFDMGGGGGGGGGGMGGASRRAAAGMADAPIDGDDIEVVLPLSFLEAVRGCNKTINVHAQAACSSCQGSGNQPNSQPSTCKHCQGKGVQTLNQGFFKINTTCPHCSGRGRSHPPCSTCSGDGTVRERRTVNVLVPAGVDVQHQLKVAGQGDAGRRGGAAGDIRVRLNIAPHPVFSREGNDVHVAVGVPLTTAALGGSVTVPTLSGEAVLKVDAGTQPGDRRVMRGKGIKDVSGRSGLQGNQYVTFNVKVPTDLTPQQRATLEQFAQQRGDRQAAQQSSSDGSQAGSGDAAGTPTSSGGSGGSGGATEAADATRAGASPNSASSSTSSSSSSHTATGSSSAAGFFSSLFGGSSGGSSSSDSGEQQQPKKQTGKKQTAGGGSQSS